MRVTAQARSGSVVEVAGSSSALFGSTLSVCTPSERAGDCSAPCCDIFGFTVKPTLLPLPGSTASMPTDWATSAAAFLPPAASVPLPTEVSASVPVVETSAEAGTSRVRQLFGSDFTAFSAELPVTKTRPPLPCTAREPSAPEPRSLSAPAEVTRRTCTRLPSGTW